MDALVKQPQGCAIKFFGADIRQPAKINMFTAVDITFTFNVLNISVIVGLLIRRHQPPQGIVTGEQNAGAIKFFQQQIVQRAAAAFTTQMAMIAAPELTRIHQKDGGFHFHTGGPFFNRCRARLQFFNLLSVQIAVMYDPDIEVAFVAVGDGAGAAHEIEAVNIKFPVGAFFPRKAFG